MGPQGQEKPAYLPGPFSRWTGSPATWFDLAYRQRLGRPASSPAPLRGVSRFRRTLGGTQHHPPIVVGDVRHGTLRHPNVHLQNAGVHVLPDGLKWGRSRHPLFHDHGAVPRQDAEDHLSRILGILQCLCSGECLPDRHGLRARPAGYQVVVVLGL